MNLKELIKHAEKMVGDDWEKLLIDIPDELNGGYMTINEENVVIENGIMQLDFSKTYPDVYDQE